MLAREVMQKKVVTVGPDMSLREAGKVFHESRISGAPVVDAEGNLVGVVSQTDLARHRHRAAKDGSFWKPELAAKAGVPEVSSTSIKVHQVMNSVVFSAKGETPVRDLMRLMVKEKIHRVVITDEGRLSGIVTTMDVLRGVLHWLNRTAQDLDS